MSVHCLDKGMVQCHSGRNKNHCLGVNIYIILEFKDWEGRFFLLSYILFNSNTHCIFDPTLPLGVWWIHSREVSWPNQITKDVLIDI